MKLFGSKKYSIWRDPLFAALIGVLTAFLLIANVSDVAENGFMHLRVWLARHFFVPGGGTSGCDAILDVYAAGVLPQVVLVDMYYGLPGIKSYVSGRQRNDIRQGDIERMRRGLLVEAKS